MHTCLHARVSLRLDFAPDFIDLMDDFRMRFTLYQHLFNLRHATSAALSREENTLSPLFRLRMIPPPPRGHRRAAACATYALPFSYFIFARYRDDRLF